MLGSIRRKEKSRESTPVVTPGRMSAVNAVEEAFKVLGDPSLPMVERVRTGKDILRLADTPTKIIENARVIRVFRVIRAIRVVRVIRLELGLLD